MKKLISRIEKAVIHLLSYIDVFSDPYKYSRELHTYKPHSTHQARQELFKVCLQNHLVEVFGENFNIKKFDIGNDSVYSIIDHHDFLNHPSFIFSNITGNLFRFNEKSTKVNEPSNKPRAIISITDSGIPADHFGNRRGVRFDGYQFRFFSHNERHRLSFGAPVITDFNLVKQAGALGLSGEKILFLKEIEVELCKVSQNPKVTSFDSQISITNNILWKHLFLKEFTQYVPELFHVSGEVLVSLMLQIYLKDEHNTFYKILFDKHKREHVIKSFDMISGCWKIDGHPPSNDGGTYFFWAVNEKGNSERLWLEDNTLVNKNKTICINFTPKDIIDALIRRQIYPGLFLVYGVLTFYCGIKPLTGGRSTQALVAMKERWLIIESVQECNIIQCIPVSNLVQSSTSSDYCLDLIYKNKLNLSNLKRYELFRINSIRIASIKAVFRKWRSNKI